MSEMVHFTVCHVDAG